jgi:ribosomal protein L7Ae-like RNA K-turn-binding protein
VERLLRRALLDRLAMAQKAGLVVQGFEKVREVLKAGAAYGILIASDAAADGRDKLLALAKSACNLHNERTVVDVVSSAELEATLGRERAVHVALTPGRLSELLFTDAARLRQFAFGETLGATHREQPDEHAFAGPLAV